MTELKKMTLEQFKEKLRKESDNTFEGDGIAKVFAEFCRDFGIFCRKCGSKNIHLTGEDGIDWGGATGYAEGTNVIKCGDCGNAVTFYK